MFSKFIAAAALTVVSAADVPLFSSNDDYDEINLNIRMLSNKTTASTDVETTITQKSKLTMDCGCTATDLAPGGSKAANFETGYCTSVKGKVTGCTDCDVTAVADASRRLSEKRRLAAITVEVTSKLKFASAAAATAAKTVVDNASFLTAAELQSALVSAGMSGVTVSSLESKGATVDTPAAAAPAAAAPSPSPSSNAAAVGVSTLAAFAAFTASLL